MKLAIELGPPDDEWETHIAYALEAERLGIDFTWSPELWGYDAVTPLAYLAAKTSFCLNRHDGKNPPPHLGGYEFLNKSCDLREIFQLAEFLR